MMSWSLEFVGQSIFRLQESVARIEICLGELTEEEVWTKPNVASNSIGTLTLHLCGNARQYIVAALGEQKDTRKRSEEFIINGVPKADLLANMLALMNEVTATLKQLTIEDLLKQKTVQAFHLSGIGIILHVVEHFSYHTGQIVFWTKRLKNKDLGFYADYDLS